MCLREWRESKTSCTGISPSFHSSIEALRKTVALGNTCRKYSKELPEVGQKEKVLLLTIFTLIPPRIQSLQKMELLSKHIKGEVFRYRVIRTSYLCCWRLSNSEIEAVPLPGLTLLHLLGGCHLSSAPGPWAVAFWGSGCALQFSGGAAWFGFSLGRW